ncbi:hypothetical protein [Citrobacter werkmanii]|uniref:hypothetical protein n=1 Tax=Citrobacter werkmanii TaxID=67827 RepID=UPI00388CF213
MNDFVFPFDSLPVPEALAKLNEMGTAPFKITQGDVETWFGEGKIELCFNWGGLIVPSWEDMNIIWNDPATHPTYVSQIDAKPYGENVAFSPLKIPHFCEYCDSDTDHQELLFLSLHISSMVLPRAEVEKIYQMVKGLDTPCPDESKAVSTELIKMVHGNAERNALMRERILLAAGYVKFTYPSECKNKRGKESCAAWAAALLDHWHLFGDDNDIPSIRVTEDIIRDIFKLPAARRRAGKTTP